MTQDKNVDFQEMVRSKEVVFRCGKCGKEQGSETEYLRHFVENHA